MTDDTAELQTATSPEHNDQVIPLPPRPKTLGERFEEGRRDNLNFQFRILGCAALPGAGTALDRFAPEELPEAADEILTAHAARMLIRSIAKVEQGWARYDGNSDLHAVRPYEETIPDLLRERDEATEYYLKVREKRARIEHLESICARGKTITFSSQRLPRARQKKNSAG